MSQPALFLSYAREDSEAARRLADALRAFGFEVWFDQSELRGGDEWDARIRERIRSCALFVALISKHTQQRREGYFRREWKLAADRTHDMAGGSPFILPVILDDTAEGAALVPDEFKRVHVTRLLNGVPTTQFIDTVRGALEGAVPSASSAPAPRVVAPQGSFPRAIWVAAIALVVAAVAWFGWRAFTARSAHAGPPVVLLMDSPYVDRVYDPETLKTGGTNADDITDALRELPVTLIKENTSSVWHRENEVLKFMPDLVVMHRSAFFTFPKEREGELYPLNDNKVVAFMGYVATVNPRVKFIIYSRHSFESDAFAAQWRSDAVQRFPVLEGKIETWRVPLDRATFRHPLTAQELRRSVERALGLRVGAARE